MERYKINIKSPIYGTKEVKMIKFYKDSQNQLNIKLADSDMHDVFSGDTITFIRYADRGDYSFTIVGDLLINNIDNGTILTNPIENYKLYPIEAPSLLYNDNNELIGAKYDFNEAHNIFLQDLLNKNTTIALSGYTENGEILSAFTSLEVIKGAGFDFATSSDTYFVTTEKDCNGLKTVTKYIYLPMEFSTNSLFIYTNTELNREIIYFERNGNPFYWVDSEMNCHLWEDILEPDNKIITLNKNYGYWELPIAFGNNIDNESLGTDELQRESLIEEKISESIPPVIDMERIKFSPIVNRTSSGSASSLIINMHFRKRAIMKDDNGDNMYDENGNIIFKDGWYIDDEDSGWFESGICSDLVGYLDFTDNDIFYQKSKVKKSFLRLSFYDSNDPLTQSLLYYSTIFLDSGELYGKYVRQKDAIDNFEINWDYAVGLCPSNEISARVDTQLVITNEYDRTKSAEGFNIYLFAEDMNVNSSSTIYMKAEFNHAGNGKTLPLVLIKTDEELKNGILLDDYLSRLYIKINLDYINNNYHYYFDEDDISMDSNNIILTLYEPKLNTENGENI